jgi:hypothetical protein
MYRKKFNHEAHARRREALWRSGEESESKRRIKTADKRNINPKPSFAPLGLKMLLVPWFRGLAPPAKYLHPFGVLIRNKSIY